MRIFIALLCAVLFIGMAHAQEITLHGDEAMREFFVNGCRETPSNLCFDVYVEAEAEDETVVSGYIVLISATSHPRTYGLSSEYRNGHADDIVDVDYDNIRVARFFDEEGKLHVFRR